MSLHKIDGLWWPRPTPQPNLAKRCLSECSKIMKHVARTRRGTAIQGGGNVGIWPLFLADRFARVYTFEPEPMNYAAMLLNVWDRRNIVPVHAALGERVGMVTLIPKGMMAHQMVPEEGTTTCWAIDALGVTDCDLIMLDIEGAELLALRGAVETIRRCKPTLAVEINWLHDRIASEREVRAFLEAEGYSEVERVTHDVVFVHKDKR